MELTSIRRQQKKACKQVHSVLAGDKFYGKNNKAGHRRERILRGAKEQELIAIKILAFTLGDFRDHWRILSRVMTCCNFSKTVQLICREQTLSGIKDGTW